MATLLNSIYFVFKLSFLPKYRVINYDYTVKWCSLINCNWCVWLDIVYILALRKILSDNIIRWSDIRFDFLKIIIFKQISCLEHDSTAQGGVRVCICIHAPVC